VTQNQDERRFVGPSEELCEASSRLRELAEVLLNAAIDNSAAKADLRALRDNLRRATQTFEGLRAAAGSEPFYTGPAMETGHHPFVPVFQLETLDGISRGQFRLGRPFEGPPGCVHGGHIAYLYDSCMGIHNMRMDSRGLTGKLEIRYHRTTPLEQPIDVEIETLDQRTRRALVRGRMFHGDQLLTEARGLFVRTSLKLSEK
jgi:acyl-coenzyme A thioesterase PaaI-like protein